MQFVRSTDGTRIAVERAGTGAHLLLVHGTSANSSRWQPVLATLSAHFTVHALDRRGHGSSQDAPSYRLDREGEDIVACLDATGEARVDVVAHSFGALCALSAAAMSNRIRRLILFEPPIPTYPGAYYPAGLIDSMRDALARGQADEAVTHFVTGVFHPEPEELASMRNLTLWKDMCRTAPLMLRELEAVDAFKLDAQAYRSWTIPTLLVLGGESPPQYRATIERLNTILTGSRVVVLEGAGHSAMRTAPDLFAGAILDFLKP